MYKKFFEDVVYELNIAGVFTDPSADINPEYVLRKIRETLELVNYDQPVLSLDADIISDTETD